MATYAAYRHVELDKIGYGKRRVLKPPGGGTSELFTPGEQVESPRKARANQPSMILPIGDPSPTSNGIEPTNYKPGNETHNRIFGPAQAVNRIDSNRNKSSIVLGEVQVNTMVKEEKEISQPDSSGDAVDNKTGDEGNPVTGEGYDTPKPAAAAIQVNGNGGMTSQAANKARVPPGGYSSGLW